MRFLNHSWPYWPVGLVGLANRFNGHNFVSWMFCQWKIFVFLAIYFLPSGKFWTEKNQIRQILQRSQIRQQGESPTGAPLQAVKFADWRLEVGGRGWKEHQDFGIHSCKLT